MREIIPTSPQPELLESGEKKEGPSFSMGSDPQSMVKLLREFTIDTAIKDIFKNEGFMTFGIMGKDIVLSNIDENFRKRFNNNFYVIRDRYLNSLRYKDITNEMQMKLDGLKNLYQARLLRAMGPGRERVQLTTEVRQQITSSDFGKAKRPGFFGRIFGFRGKQQG